MTVLWYEWYRHPPRLYFPIPKFGDTKGRIDFFLPQFTWGIEVTRYLVSLEEDIQRFMRNKFGTWAKTLKMLNYTIVNFITSGQRM